jgi:hypothetical protein
VRRLIPLATGVLVATLAATPCGAAPGEITTYIGTGTPGSTAGMPGTAGQIHTPTGMAVDVGEFDVWMATPPSHQIRMYNISVVTLGTAAGLGTPGWSGDGGSPLSAELSSPRGVAVNPSNNRIIIADTANQRIRAMTIGPGGISLLIDTIAGTGLPGYSGDGGAALLARLHDPVDVDVDDNGRIYVADVGNHVVRAIRTTPPLTITTVAGTGSMGYGGDGGAATAATLNEPRGVGLDRFGNLYIADTGNHVIRRVDKVTQKITTVAGSGIAGYTGDGASALLATLRRPYDVTVDHQGNLLVADTNNHAIRFVDGATGDIETIAGTGAAGFGGDGGPATLAQLNGPEETTIDAYGAVLIADTQNHRVRRIEPVPLLLDHLQCFQVGDSGRFDAVVDLRGLGSKGFYEGCDVIGKAVELCVPVQKNVVSSTAALLAVNGAPVPENRICYRLRCGPKVKKVTPLDDQFGNRDGKLGKPVKLCTPVGFPTTTSTTTSTTTTTSTLPCTVAFVGTPTTGPVPLAVAFTNQSTGCCTTFLWDFGDTGTSTSSSPVYNYFVPGTYDVSLQAMGPAGCSGVETKVGYINVF